MQTIDQKKFTHWFWFIIILHTCAWTVIPTLLRSALPMDALETSIWGHLLLWGYDRNPWVMGWAGQLGQIISGSSGWGFYFFSQLCVLTAFISIWRLGKKILPSVYPIIAALMLEGIQYYSLAAVDFNDNVLLLGLWPLLALFFYNAVTTQKIIFWVGVGIISALAMMVKYNTVLFLLPMLLFVICNTEARKNLKHLGIYLSTLLFLAIITPHIIWLFNNDFITVRYAIMRTDATHQTFNLWQHFQSSLHFTLVQLLNFVGACILLLAFSTRESVSHETYAVTPFNKQFLWFIAAGPFLLTIGLSTLSGWYLHSLWGIPYLSLWGLLLFCYWQPTVTQQGITRFIIVTLLIFSGFLLAFTINIFTAGESSSANFPAQNISRSIHNIWYQRYHKPLKYLAGDRYINGYVAYYSKDKPAIYVEWNKIKSPWIDEKDVRTYGAVFLQKSNEGLQFPKEISQRFPRLQILPIQHFQAARVSRKHHDPIGILIGILPPEN